MKKIFAVSITCLMLSGHAYANSIDTRIADFFQSIQAQSVATGSLASKPQPNRQLTPMLMYAKAHWDQLSTQTRHLVQPWFYRPDDAKGKPPSGVSFYTPFQVPKLKTIQTTH